MSRRPMSDEEARKVVADNNASNALESIEPNPAADEIGFQFLTGRITGAQMWRRLREQWIAEHGHITPEMEAMYQEAIQESED